MRSLARARLPLQQAQRWAADRLEPGGHHNVGLAARCRGSPDPAQLERAMEAFAFAHPLLRARFPGASGRPELRVEIGGVRELSSLDLRGGAGEALERASELASRPFDVERGPLWRLGIVRAGDSRHVVVAAAHRLIADRASLKLLLRCVLGGAEPAAGTCIEETLTAGVAASDDDLSRWRAALSALEPMPLPLDHPRPRIALRRRAMQRIAISGGIARRLEALAKEAGVDAAIAFAAAVQVVLHAYGGRRDLALGWMERSAPQDRFGPLTRMLLLRNEVPDGDAAALLHAIAAGIASARQLSTMDVEVADEVLGHGARDAGVPRPQVVVSVDDDAARPEPWAELIDLDTGAGASDLAFHLRRTAHGLGGHLDYDRGLFEPVTAARMVAHLSNAATALCEMRRPREISITGDEERCFILASANAAAVHRSAVARVQDLFEAQVDRAPDRVAVSSLEGEVTYAELEARANRLAHHLRKSGIQAGAVVAILLERSLEAVVAMIAALKAGAAYVPLDAGFPAERIAAIVEDADVRAAITDAALAAKLPSHVALVRVDVDRLQIDLRSAVRLDPSSGASDLAYVIYTSGSTGKPKGVAIEQRCLVSYTQAAIQQYALAASDRVLQFASLSFDASVEEIFPTLCSGAALVLRPEWMLDSVGLFLRKCAEWRISALTLPTAYWHEVARKVAGGEEALPECLRLVIIGGEAARADLVAAWLRRVGHRVRLLNTYGPTETTVVATCWDATCADPDLPPQEVPIGRPLANCTAYVLGPGLQLTPVGVVGELHVGGTGVARGYIGRPDLTAERFLRDPFSADPGARMYRTGDRCRLLWTGELEFAGRADDQVKVRGFRVEPSEIEAQLAAHPGVEQVAVISTRKASGSARLTAYVVARGRLSQQELRAWLRRRVPEFMVPAGIVFLDRLPLNSSGKVDRRALPETAPVESQPGAAPRTPMEQLVGKVFREVLHVAAVGARDAFLAIGGSSLGAVQIAAQLSEKLGHPIGARDVLETSTVEALAARISARLTGADPVPPASEGLEAEAVLDPEIRPPASPAAVAPFDRCAVFLTGATGFMGSFLLRSILEKTAGPVHCLVRASDAGEARARLQAAWQRGAGSAPLPDRVAAVAGDLARERLGVAAAIWDALAEQCEVVLHAGATVSYLLPYASLRSANVLGTQEILRFAVHRRLKQVHHVSTISVAAVPAHRSVENHGLADPASLDDGYAQSKWVSERLARTGAERGIPLAIHRPGRLTGDSRTGVANENDFLVRLLQACVRAGALPELEVDVDMTPVDYASAAVAALAGAGEANGVFHLVHPEPVAWTAVTKALEEFGWRLRKLPFAAWTRALRRSSQDGDGVALYFAGVDEQQLRTALEAQHGCERTAAQLSALGVRCSRVDTHLLRVYLRHLVRAGTLPPPF